MAQTIKLKRSSTSGRIPTTSDLALGEVAINTYDGKMYIKKNVGGTESIVEIGGSSGTVTDAFKTIAVSGQTSVVADSATDTLTLVAGTNMSITTNASGDSITFASTGSSGSATFLGLSDTPANFTGAAGKYLKVNSSGNSVEFDTLNFDDLGTTPTTISGYGITDAFDGAFSSLTGKPTTISGYGITDALQLGTTATTALAGNTSIPSSLTDLGITDGSNGQVLQTDGNGSFSFVNSTGGNSFGTIAVSGQSNVVADQGNDTLTLVAGSNVTITTNASGDSITIASSGSGGGSGLSSTFTLYEYTATSGQTTFSGSDGNSNTLAYDTGTPPKILVYLNGVLLDHTTDYTATNGTSVVLTNGAAANDLLQIAAYASSVSTNLDIDLADSQKILFGDDDDLQIYHDGSTNNSVIKETGSGNLELWGNNVKIMNVAGTETQLNANPNGQVELYYDNSKKLETTSSGIQVQGAMASTTGAYSPIYYGGSSSLQLKSNTGELFGQFTNNGAAELYYDNSKKFETSSTGATLTGTLAVDSINLGDSDAINMGTSDDFQIYHDGSNSYVYDAGTGYLVLMSNGPGIRLNKSNAEVMLDATPDGAVSLYYDNAVKLATTSTGATVSGSLTVQAGDAATSAHSITSNGGDLVLKAGADDVVLRTGGSGTEGIYFQDGAQDTKMFIDAENGRVGIGTTSPGTKLHVTGITTFDGDGASRAEITSSTANSVVSLDIGGFNGTPSVARDIRFLTNAAANNKVERMRIDSSGRVGIGTATPFTVGGTAKLSLSTSTNVYLTAGASNSDLIYSRRFSSGHYQSQAYNGGNNGIIEHNPYGGKVGVGTAGTVSSTFQVEALGIDTTTTSTTATTQVAIDTFAAATFRSARYTIQVTNSTDSTYHLTEVLLIHDGTTPQITEYGTIFTGSAEATFDADISSGNVRLLATPATTDSMTFKVVRHCITV